MSSERRMYSPDLLAVALTSYYPNFNDKDSSDRVRGKLALRLLELARKKGHQVALVDGSSHPDFLEELKQRQINFQPQDREGMWGSRFQVYDIAGKLPGVEVIGWVEIEKAPLFKYKEFWEAAQVILAGKADVIIPGRSEDGLNSLPANQKLSELSANSILNTTLKRYHREFKLFPEYPEIPDIDWFFGPKIFAKDLLPQFTNETQFWKDFKQEISQKPELAKAYGYCGPLILPVIWAMQKGLKVRGIEMTSYRHPTEQTELETQQESDFHPKRIFQLEKINLTVDLFCQHLVSNQK